MIQPAFFTLPLAGYAGLPVQVGQERRLGRPPQTHTHQAFALPEPLHARDSGQHPVVATPCPGQQLLLNKVTTPDDGFPHQRQFGVGADDQPGAMQGHILEEARLTGVYSLNPSVKTQ